MKTTRFLALIGCGSMLLAACPAQAQETVVVEETTVETVQAVECKDHYSTSWRDNWFCLLYTSCVVNAANEVAVAAFLGEKIKFRQIYDTIEHTLAHMPFMSSPAYEDYVNYNTEARRVAADYINTL